MKEVRYENHRVVITLNQRWLAPRTAEAHHRDQQRRAKELADQVLRHADVGDPQSAFSDDVEVEWDEVAYCSHCALEWEEDDAGRPQCCEAAQVEWVAAELEGQHG